MLIRPAIAVLATGAILVACLVLIELMRPSSGPAGPSKAPTPYSLGVNVDYGPTVVILIDGREVASVSYPEGASLTAGANGIPPLPWSLDMQGTDGTVLGHFEINGGTDDVLEVRGGVPRLSDTVSSGPLPPAGACSTSVS